MPSNFELFQNKMPSDTSNNGMFAFIIKPIQKMLWPLVQPYFQLHLYDSAKLRKVEQNLPLINSELAYLAGELAAVTNRHTEIEKKIDKLIKKIDEIKQ